MSQASSQRPPLIGLVIRFAFFAFLAAVCFDAMRAEQAAGNEQPVVFMVLTLLFVGLALKTAISMLPGLAHLTLWAGGALVLGLIAWSFTDGGEGARTLLRQWDLEGPGLVLAGAAAFAAALVILPKLLRKPFERIQQLWRAARELKKGHFGTARYATNADIKKTDLYKPGGSRVLEKRPLGRAPRKSASSALPQGGLAPWLALISPPPSVPTCASLSASPPMKRSS